MTEAATSPRRHGGLVRRLPWRWFRRAFQLAALILFFWLFRRTESSGADTLAHPVNLFFRIDPLVAASVMLGGRVFLPAFWPALAALGLTMLLGRIFCGWFCPLGTMLDLFHRLLRPLARRTNRLFGRWPQRLRPVRYVALVLVLACAALGLPLVGYLDPFALLVRPMAMSGDSAIYRGANAAFAAADQSRFSVAADRAYPFVRDYVLPFSDRVFLLAGTALAMLAAIFALDMIKRRFWCRYICPLGAMVGLAAKVSPLRRLPAKSCPNCPSAESCSQTCRMDAFAANGSFKPDDCNLCMDCLADCPDTRSSFRFKRQLIAAPPVDLSRRAALVTLASGIAIPAVAHAARLGRSSTPNPDLLRPPGVGAEKHFLDLCVRCGLCLKVCPTNGLQPASLIAGIEGIFSPRLLPRMGYCEIGCTLCGQVCPTGAIPRLDPKPKATTIIGKAVIDFDRCLPWAKDEECICCEEHCPVPEKAIEFDEVPGQTDAGDIIMLKQPFVHWDRCTGCGICENKCPIDGESAIHVRRVEAVPRGEGRGHGGGRGQGRGGGGGRGGGRGRGRGRGEGEIE